MRIICENTALSCGVFGVASFINTFWKLKEEKLNVHSRRHTDASLLIANGTDVATVAGILGHSQPSTTLDIYTHAFDKNKKAASAELQGMLEI